MSHVGSFGVVGVCESCFDDRLYKVLNCNVVFLKSCILGVNQFALDNSLDFAAVLGERFFWEL